MNGTFLILIVRFLARSPRSIHLGLHEVVHAVVATGRRSFSLRSLSVYTLALFEFTKALTLFL